MLRTFAPDNATLSCCTPHCTCLHVCGLAVAIWRAVAEDYARFDIDVTTVEPVGVSAVNVSHVCIGGLSSALSPTVDESVALWEA
jgi:hypothetical protein